MNNETQETKQLTPPYISISKLERTFELMSGRNFAEISIQTFMSYGFSKIDAQLAVSMLRFLSFIDDEGKATELMVKLRLNGEPRKQAFEQIVRNAYQKLFAVVPEPQNLNASELLTDFRVHYDLSERVARAAVPAFIKLCEFAGLKEEGSIIGRKREPKAKSATESSPKHTETEQPSKTSGKVSFGQPQVILTAVAFRLSDDLVLQISPELNNRVQLDDNLNEKWRTLLKGLKSFAEETSPKKESELEAETDE